MKWHQKGELHTNFKIGSNKGGFLALVHKNGFSAVTFLTIPDNERTSLTVQLTVGRSLFSRRLLPASPILLLALLALSKILSLVTIVVSMKSPSS